MSALVRFGRRTAIFRSGLWVTADPEFEAALNQYTSQWFQQGLAPSHTPDQELEVAREVARYFGGRVGVHLRTRRRAADKYFFSQRQMGFDF